MSVSSKFGLKVGTQNVYELKGPQDALELMRAVCQQFLGDSFTTYQPRCPVCDTNLSDHEKHMNKPVGECTNEKCGCTIHAADYIGKMLDILAEWDKSKDDWEEKMKTLIANQGKLVDDDDDDDEWEYYPRTGHALKLPQRTENSAGFVSDEDFIEKIDGEPVFLW